MATHAVSEITAGRNSKPGRPRRELDATHARRLRDEGKTLNEIAALLGCGRGTVARALERAPAPRKSAPAPRAPLAQRAGELARSRNDPPGNDAAERERLRENARHLAHRRWGDGMKVEGESFKPAEPKREGPGWVGVALMAGGLLLWALGCPVPL